MVRIAKQCPECYRVKPGAPYLVCKRCGSHTHLECLGFSAKEAEQIKTFSCLDCTGSQEEQVEFVELPDTNRRQEPEPLRETQDGVNLSQSSKSSQAEGSENQAPETAPQPEASEARQANDEPQPSTSSGATTGSRIILRLYRSPAGVVTAEEPEYPVEEILNMRTKDGKEQYEILWGDGSKTWEPEANLQGCVKLVNGFRTSRGLSKSTLVEVFGASGDASETNSANWVPISGVLAAVDKFDRIKDGFPPVEEFPGQGERSIRVLGFQQHLLVLYTSPFSGTTYIADGTDWFLQSPEVNKKITEFLGYQPIGVRFVGQNHVDYCASSAVMIALEFRRSYRARQEPTLLKAERTIYERVRKEFHQYASRATESPEPLRNLAPDVCPFCGKEFASRNRRQFAGHVAGHKRRSR